MDGTQSLDAFRLYLSRDKGQLSSTIKSNIKLVSKILRECSPITIESVNSLINKLIDNELDVDYINQHIILIRYWAQCFNISDLKAYPYCKLKKRNDFIRATMSDQEIEAFLNLPNPFAKGCVYWKRYEMWNIFWAIGAYEASRPGETVRLRKTPTQKERSYIDFGRNYFIFDQKTGLREVPISFVIREKVKNYVDTLCDGEYLFPPLHKSKTPYMQGEAWQDDFRKRIERLEPLFPGISKRLNLEPYSLRHSAPTRWIEEGASLPAVQKAMGHRKLTTTQTYLHLSNKPVAEMIDDDRLALPYKKGKEIVNHYIDLLDKADKKYSEKVFIDIRKKSKDGKKYLVYIEAKD